MNEMFVTSIGGKMYAMSINGRKNITDAIVRAFVSAWLTVRNASDQTRGECLADVSLMKYIKNGIQKGTVEERHTEFSEEVYKETGMKSEDWYMITTKYSVGGYSKNEVIFVEG